jgi:hypothetical protein
LWAEAAMDIHIVEYEMGIFEMLLWLGAAFVLLAIPLAIVGAMIYIAASLLKSRRR